MKYERYSLERKPQDGRIVAYLNKALNEFYDYGIKVLEISNKKPERSDSNEKVYPHIDFPDLFPWVRFFERICD